MPSYTMLIGTVANDPESRYFNDNKKVTFRIRVERNFLNQDGTRYSDYHNVVAWGNVAKIEAENIIKDVLIITTGEFRNRSYDAQDGTKKYVTEFNAASITVFGGGEQPQEEQVAVPDMNSLPDLELDDDTDDLPF